MKIDEETSMTTVDDVRSPPYRSCAPVHHHAGAANGSRNRTAARFHAEADALPLHTEPPPHGASPAITPLPWPLHVGIGRRERRVGRERMDNRREREEHGRGGRGKKKRVKERKIICFRNCYS
jgi:hypothetical protein